MLSTDFIFRHHENLVDNQKCQAAMQQNTIEIQLHKGFDPILSDIKD